MVQSPSRFCSLGPWDATTTEQRSNFSRITRTNGNGTRLARLKRTRQLVKGLPANLHARVRRAISAQEFFFRVVARFDPVRQPAGKGRHPCYRRQRRNGFDELSPNV